MKLGFCLEYLSDYLPDPVCVQYQIISFLSACPQVEVLMLTFYNLDDDAFGRAELSYFSNMTEMFRECTWHKLECLKVSNCAISEEIFLEFMCRHSQHLRALEANGLQLTDNSNSWQHAIETIAPVMTLDSVRLEGLHDGGLDERAMADGDLRGKGVTVRLDAYYARVSAYLRLGGKGKYPVWDEIDEPTLIS